jgi:hypothetical protein
MNYGTADFGDGPEDVLEKLSPELHYRQIQRIAGSFDFDLPAIRIFKL